MKLREILVHRKGFITIDDSQVYKLCRVQLHRKGVVLRESILGERIKTKKQQVCKNGDFIVAEMDAKVGGYGFIPSELDGAIVSSHYFLFELDEEKVNRGYFSILVKFGFFQSQIKAVGSTNYAAVRPSDVLNWEVPVPSLIEQEQIRSRIEEVVNEKDILVSELSTQLSLLTALRQAILTEAVQGKLTAQWRKENPNQESAAELLRRIAAEKVRLIKEKKIGKEKPLPPIKAEEMPYELPEGWVWCRLGEVVELISGQHIETADYNNRQIGVPYLTGPSDFGDKYPIFTRWSSVPKVLAQKNDILITVKGSGVGKLNVLHIDDVAIGRQLMAIRSNTIDRNYIYLFLDGNYSELQNQKIGVAIPGIGREDILYKKFPLPPLLEQQAIVQKVNALLAYCDELEQQVRQSQADLELLMQAVLGEVFDRQQ